MTGSESSPVEYRPAVSTAEVDQARRLHGRVYLACGYVERLEDGKVEDAYVQHSEYFVAVQSGQVLGVCRQILPTGPDLPCLRYFDIEPAKRRDLLRMCQAEDVVEVSALAVERTPQFPRGMLAANLYRSMWQHAMRLGARRYWLAAVDDALLSTLRDVFAFPFRPLGPSRQYMGGVCTPCLMDSEEAAGYMIPRNPAGAKWFFEGLPTRFWPADAERMLAPPTTVVSQGV